MSCMVPVNSTVASERASEALLRRREEKMALTPIKLVPTKIRNTIFVMSSKACKSEQKASLLGTSDPELKERTHAEARRSRSLQAGAGASQEVRQGAPKLRPQRQSDRTPRTHRGVRAGDAARPSMMTIRHIVRQFTQLREAKPTRSTK